MEDDPAGRLRTSGADEGRRFMATASQRACGTGKPDLEKGSELKLHLDFDMDLKVDLNILDLKVDPNLDLNVHLNVNLTLHLQCTDFAVYHCSVLCLRQAIVLMKTQ